ncbi:unnamed protein product [Didymodactylos carnosus]|uniref:HAT C-terminal dimerisation domain-containing protein n=1 Tax=Didymodactylos carnosus TaxID=1234261 RepID=A0A814VDU0_9BILA|nr:unnamed protein product [Didymodactylos carnosus]CAF3951044.1 unnamed protein product [Didymodactylos carnosus]
MPATVGLRGTSDFDNSDVKLFKSVCRMSCSFATICVRQTIAKQTLEATTDRLLVAFKLTLKVYYDLLLPLAIHINCDKNHLFNEIQVLRSMLVNKELSNVTELYHEIKPLREAFPNMMSMVKAALTIPVSSATCERVFSKMKLIKTRLRNTMADERLSNLCILSIERDFQVNFQQIIEQFSASHKNSRIMLH